MSRFRFVLGYLSLGRIFCGAWVAFFCFIGTIGFFGYSPWYVDVLLGLIVFLATVRERKWASDMEEETARLGLDESVDEKTGETRRLSRAEFRSLLLILSSVALWYIGYNSISTVSLLSQMLHRQLSSLRVLN